MLFNNVLTSTKPFIRRVQGMSIGGGEEISGCRDLTIRRRYRHSRPGRATHGSHSHGAKAVQFKSVSMTIEDAV